MTCLMCIVRFPRSNREELNCAAPLDVFISGSIVYNRSIAYIRQNLLTNVVQAIIIDQWNQTAGLYEIQVTVIYSRVILVTVTIIRPSTSEVTTTNRRITMIPSVLLNALKEFNFVGAPLWRLSDGKDLVRVEQTFYKNQPASRYDKRRAESRRLPAPSAGEWPRQPTAARRPPTTRTTPARRQPTMPSGHARGLDVHALRVWARWPSYEL